METYSIHRIAISWMMRVISIGLLVAICPKIGFAQDANEPVEAVDSATATEVTDEAPAALADEVAAASQDTWSAFGVITQNNIFSRDRRPYEAPTPRPPRETPPPPNPETYYVLFGIVQENDIFTAFLQDNQRGGVLRLREGDEVARGTIASVGLDSLEYAFEERTVSVTLGQNLEGSQAARRSADQRSRTDSSAAAQRTRATPTDRTPDRRPDRATTPPAQQIPTGDPEELIRQLMERRRQQLGQ